MSDIVERLLAPSYWISGSDEGHEGDNNAPIEAAKTIESLRAELAKVNMEVDRLTRTNQAKREHRDKLLEAGVKAAARIEQLEAALRDADKGLTAVIKQYAAHNHVTGEVVAGDEQYPWIRLALIGRDAARAALGEHT